MKVLWAQTLVTELGVDGPLPRVSNEKSQWTLGNFSMEIHSSFYTLFRKLLQAFLFAL